jgi:hypothetical protein
VFDPLFNFHSSNRPSILGLLAVRRDEIRYPESLLSTDTIPHRQMVNELEVLDAAAALFVSRRAHPCGSSCTTSCLEANRSISDSDRNARYGSEPRNACSLILAEPSQSVRNNCKFSIWRLKAPVALHYNRGFATYCFQCLSAILLQYHCT